MKKQLLLAALGLAATLSHAQIITDTVSLGAPNSAGVSYPNQVWYSLPNDEQGSHDRTEWDIAFDLKNITSGAIINSPSGVTLWKYPKGNLATGWATADTAGLSTWTPHYNSDTAWELGAIGRYADAGSATNLDWGTYNTSTHAVTGDSLYIIRLGNGQYKKFAIESLISGVYTFKFADMDGSSAQTRTIAKSSYAGKNFVYFSFTGNTILDREPPAASWDLLFTQYTTFIPIAYNVTGVLLKQGVQAVRVSGLTDKNTYVNYSAHTFSGQINTIGYDWKSFTGSAYAVRDSQVYFVKRTNGDIWKMIFTGFGGAASGNFIFSKEQIFTAPTGIGAVNASAASMTLYPNPARGQQVHVIYDLSRVAGSAQLSVYDLSGRKVHSAVLESTACLHQYELPAASFTAGLYMVCIETPAGRMQQQLIVQ